MTRDEFSSGFDTLVNSYTRFRDFDRREPQDTIDFNEFEKSLFLTKAQEELAISLYNGKNPWNDSFEKTEELRRYLSPLVEEVSLEPITTSNDKPLGVDSNSKFFTLPENLWFITYESATLDDAKCDAMSVQDVFPVTQDEYHRIKRNPFRGANNRRALRLDLSDNVIEIVSKYEVSKYYVRYLRKVKPIVLENMPDEASVGGCTEASDCELHESLHQRILELAVQMALQSKGININRDK